MNTPTITIREDNDGSMWVDVWFAPSRRALAKMVKDSNWHDDKGCGADCTGQIFMGTCELVRAYRVGKRWAGVVVRTASRDV